LKARMWLPIRK